VLGFNASSSRTLPSAQMVPKTRANPQSGFLLVSTSPAPDKDFTCNPIWRWGDYSGASPDHASTSGSVWLNVMLSGNARWTTWNGEAMPHCPLEGNLQVVPKFARAIYSMAQLPG